MGYGGKLLGVMVVIGLWMPAAGMLHSENTLAQETSSPETEAAAHLAEADRLLQQGAQQYQVSQFREALQSWQWALELYRDLAVQSHFPRKSRRGEGNALNNLGLAYAVLGQHQQAIDYYKQSLAIVREIRDLQGEGNALGNLGNAYLSLSQYQQATDFFDQALLIFREIRDRQGEGKALGNLGNAYLSLDQYQQAIDYYEQQLGITREIGDRLGESNALGNLGIAYAALGQYQQAIGYYEQRLAIAREISDHRGQGQTLNNLGEAYRKLSQYKQAIDFYEQSFVIAREIGDRPMEGSALGNLGIAYFDLGQYQQAIDYYEQQLRITREIGDRQGVGNALGSLGNSYFSLGQYQQAIILLGQSLVIAREIGSRSGEGSALNNLGITYAALGQYQSAIDFHEQSLAITRAIGNRSGEKNALGGLGNSYFGLGQYQQAIDYYEQQLGITREIGDRQGKGLALNNLGNVYLSLRQYQQAIDYYEQSLAIAHEVGDRRGEGKSLGNLGTTYVGLGQYQEAIGYYEQSLAIARETGNHAEEGLTLNNLGATYYRLRQFSASTDAFLKAIAIYDTLRTTDLSDSEKISFFDTYLGTYLGLQKSLIAQNEPEQALVYAERGRARAFVELLATRTTTNGNPNAASLESISSPDLTEIQRIAREQNTILVNYSVVSDESLFIWVVQPTGEVAFRSVELDGSGNGSSTINPIAAIDGPVYRSATSDSELTALVSESRSVVGERENPNTPQLQELHKLLIDPIADLLPSDPNAQVVFIPQGQLFLVPFAALQDEDGTYLIEKHTILTAPSIQVFGLANEAVGTRNVASLSTDNALVVGNPTMPTVWLPNKDGDLAETQLSYLSGAKAEAEAIGGFFNIPALTGEQATEARVKQLLPNASLIHLATHGLLEYGIPESSGVLDLPGAIALAPGNGEDGLLTSAEILEMDLQADLAILSACDTGRGRITGDGVVGLSRALITAGVPSVMVSLWAVNDDSTSLLMQRFYEFLATGEFTKAEALRQAQLSLLYDEDTETRLEAVRADISVETSGRRDVPTGSRHPYHWAPFILIGNGL